MQALFARVWNDVYDPGSSLKAAILQEFQFRPHSGRANQKTKHEKQTISKNS